MQRQVMAEPDQSLFLCRPAYRQLSSFFMVLPFFSIPAMKDSRH